MYNCGKEILGYHDDEVTLRQTDRTSMRDRRDRNRTRIEEGLEENNDPQPLEFYKQGSYAMKTMVQHLDNRYDIDDGCYFDQEDLKDSDGNDMTPREARHMVRNAVDDGSFNTAPKVHKNCVRVQYQAGYHVDIPVYRKVVTKRWFGGDDVHYELASGDEWIRSDARDVTDWFQEENQQQSPDEKNGRQLRRQTRLIKDYAQSRSTWKGKIGSGFMITKLVTECYQSNVDREDESLYYTMEAIRDRLENDLVVEHPVTPDSTITDGDDDPKAKFLKEKLTEAINNLDVLFESDCTDEEAMEAWDTVFNTTYFTDLLPEEAEEEEEEKSAAATNTGLFKNWSNSSSPQSPVQKKGNDRYA